MEGPALRFEPAKSRDGNSLKLELILLPSWSHSASSSRIFGSTSTFGAPPDLLGVVFVFCCSWSTVDMTHRSAIFVAWNCLGEGFGENVNCAPLLLDRGCARPEVLWGSRPGTPRLRCAQEGTPLHRPEPRAQSGPFQQLQIGFGYPPMIVHDLRFLRT